MYRREKDSRKCEYKEKESLLKHCLASSYLYILWHYYPGFLTQSSYHTHMHGEVIIIICLFMLAPIATLDTGGAQPVQRWYGGGFYGF